MPTTYERRDERAKAEGWTGYPQRRYWITAGRLSLGPFATWTPAQVDIAERLARECCGAHHELGRAGSLLCTACNERVNPRTRVRGHESKWQARLVRAAASSRAHRAAARRGIERRQREERAAERRRAAEFRRRSLAARRGWETRRRRPVEPEGAGVFDALAEAFGDAAELVEEAAEEL